ncbi:unnamed protein product [Vicia faba]|uniref:Uncharacterized protein n=1 Tax=Vicia faba TaxID=3906 RepID=A0AAV0ZU45_VICFA|nr:unnamed protein product [Vicia faba]
MSGPPRVRSMNVTVGDSDSRPVLVPAGNKVCTVKKVKKPAPETEKKSSEAVMNSQCGLVTPVVLKRRESHRLVGMKTVSMNASCSSDASSTGSSTYSSGMSSTGKVVRHGRKKQVGLKVDKVSIDAVAVPVEVDSRVGLEGKKRCAWVTPNTGVETKSEDPLRGCGMRLLCVGLDWDPLRGLGSAKMTSKHVISRLAGLAVLKLPPGATITRLAHSTEMAYEILLFSSLDLTLFCNNFCSFFCKKFTTELYGYYNLK